MVALRFRGAGAFAEHAVEFVDQFVERGLGLAALHACDQVGPPDLDVTLGDKSLARITRLIVLQVEADADDMFFMPQEARGLFFGGGPQRGRESEMRAAHEDSGFGGGGDFLRGHEGGFGGRCGRLREGSCGKTDQDGRREGKRQGQRAESRVGASAGCHEGRLEACATGGPTPEPPIIRSCARWDELPARRLRLPAEEAC